MLLILQLTACDVLSLLRGGHSADSSMACSMVLGETVDGNRSGTGRQYKTWGKEEIMRERVDGLKHQRTYGDARSDRDWTR
jgi:hypothetical protein